MNVWGGNCKLGTYCLIEYGNIQAISIHSEVSCFTDVNLSGGMPFFLLSFSFSSFPAATSLTQLGPSSAICKPVLSSLLF